MSRRFNQRPARAETPSGRREEDSKVSAGERSCPSGQPGATSPSAWPSSPLKALAVLGAATGPESGGDPVIVDETLELIDPTTIAAGDVVGIGIHTGNALRGYEVGNIARERGALVVYGGIHATLFPEEAHARTAAAHAVVQGDGDPGPVWSQHGRRLASRARHQRVYDGGPSVEAKIRSLPARWDLLPADRYMWASVQTVRGCPKHCSFCSVWRTDGQKPRQRGVDIRSSVKSSHLRRQGFRFIALADDNFYPVTLERPRTWRRGVQDKSTLRRADGAPRGAFRADASARAAAAATWCSSRRSRWKRPRMTSSSTRCAARTSRARWSASRR